MAKIVSPQVDFAELIRQVKQVTPEIYDQQGNYLNLLEERWQEPGIPREFVSPIDGSVLGSLPFRACSVYAPKPARRQCCGRCSARPRKKGIRWLGLSPVRRLVRPRNHLPGLRASRSGGQWQRLRSTR